MTHAYQEIYLSNAQAALGDAFDYVIRVCGVPGENFIKLFTVSSVSKHMENGEPAYLAGKSGIELAAQILAETTGMTEQPEQPERYARSCEYWIGWAVAYYQWYSGRKYSEIFEVLSFAELEKMYYTLHEADVSKFAALAPQATCPPKPSRAATCTWNAAKPAPAWTRKRINTGNAAAPWMVRRHCSVMNSDKLLKNILLASKSR